MSHRELSTIAVDNPGITEQPSRVTKIPTPNTAADSTETNTYCFAVPHYNHSTEFARFVDPLFKAGLPVIVVDDGSEPHHQETVRMLLDAKKDTEVECHFLQHARNRGKGAAVLTACAHARTLGFTHVIQIDADGQHEPLDGFKLIEQSRYHPAAIVSGRPVFDDSAPKARLYGRKLSTLLVAFETLSWQVKDALCGFRIYPLSTTEYLIDHFHIGPRMDFDTDIIVKCCWSGFPVVFVDTPVAYQTDGTSHFHYLRDNWRLIRLHARLIPMMLIRLPVKWIKQLRKKSV